MVQVCNLPGMCFNAVMGIKQIVTDDLTGKTLPDGVKPTTVQMEGTKHEVYLSDESKETLSAMLSGDAPVMEAIDEANEARKNLKTQYDALTIRLGAVRELADVLVSTYTGDEEAPEPVKTFITSYKNLGKSPGGLPTSPVSSKASSGDRQKTDTYGYDYADVKAWAIANGIKGKTGAAVTEKTTRIGQTVYDAYKEAMDAKQ